MTVQKFIHVFASVSYSIAQISQGLFFHPYQTMQSLLRERVFFWLTFLPTAIWVVARLVWGAAVVPLVRLVFSCSSSAFWGCSLLPFFTHWLLYFCVLWQLVLLYLFVRFIYAFSKSET